MNTHVIKIPDIGEGIAEVELVEWFVQVGDAVNEDQNIASVMTDKVSVEISSPVSGTVQSLGGNAGDVLLVGSDLVCIALEANEADQPVSGNFSSSAQTPSAERTRTDEMPSMDEPHPAKTAQTNSEGSEATESDAKQQLLKGVQASPAVRKRVADLGLSLVELAEQMSVERVAHSDVDRYLQGAMAGGQLEKRDDSAPVRPSNVKTEVPVRGLRRQIAQKMERSHTEIPHFSYVEAIDMTEVEHSRRELNERWASERGHLTLLPFLVKALCLSLKAHPQLNATFDRSSYVIHQHEDVNIGIATQTQAGLMVPVLHHAQTLTLWEIAEQVKALSEAAKSGALRLDQASGSTISLSSLGPLGGIAATPIINYPELAVIGVNKMVEQPVVIEGNVVVRKMMNLSSSFDHRIIDGYDAAAFIQTLRAFIEKPVLLLTA